jgi:hypothetical protein
LFKRNAIHIGRRGHRACSKCISKHILLLSYVFFLGYQPDRGKSLVKRCVSSGQLPQLRQPAANRLTALRLPATPTAGHLHAKGYTLTDLSVGSYV